MDSPFKLLVFAIIAITVILLIVNLYPFFFPSEDTVKEMEKLLSAAETNLGQFTSKELLLPRQKIFANTFDTASRSVIFLCNEPVLCCEQGEQCPKIIEWDNTAMQRYAEAKQKKETIVSARCRLEKLFICRFYFGREPAQVSIESFGVFPDSKELVTDTTIQIDYTAKNTGKEEMIALVQAVVFQRASPHGVEEWVHAKEVEGETHLLLPGQRETGQLFALMDIPGIYKLEFIVVELGDETNFEKQDFEFRVSATNQN